MVFLEWLVEMRRRNHSRVTGKSHAPGGELSPAAQSHDPATRRPLGDLLLERNLISLEQLADALDQQRRQRNARKLLGEILIASSGISEQQLVDTLAVQARLVLGMEEAAAVTAAAPGPQTSLSLLAAGLARAAEAETSEIPEWIREYAQHPEFLASSRLVHTRAESPETLPQPAPAKSAPSQPAPSKTQSLPHAAPIQEKTNLPRRTSMLPGMTDPLNPPFPSRRILVAIGTRAEAIKLAPVIRELERRTGPETAPAAAPAAAPESDPATAPDNSLHRVFVCLTGQQQDQVEEELHAAGVRVDLNLNLVTRGQAPAALGARMLQVFSAVIQEFAPDWVLVQGDTVTTSMASLAALYAGVRVAHVEAGLRASRTSLDTGAGPQPPHPQPHPDEFNRRLIGLAAQIHFAPTPWARRNLLREGVAPHAILVTGNTGIDALRSHRERTRANPQPLPSGAGPVRVLVSASLRDDSQGDSYQARIAGLCSALLNLVNRNPGRYLILWPLDPDPLLTGLAASILGGLDDVLLAGPACHGELLEYLEKSDLVLTDSGALQEEAPSFGKPVLILSHATERPEGVNAGLAWLIGTAGPRIERAIAELAPQVAERRTLRSTANPYGDGFASTRISDFFAGRQVAEFGVPAPEPAQHPTAEPLQHAAVAWH